MKILDDVTDEEIKSLEIPTGVPLVYELNEDMQPIGHFHVGYSTFNISQLFVNTAVHKAHSCLASKAVLHKICRVIACSCRTCGVAKCEPPATSIALHLCAPLFM